MLLVHCVILFGTPGKLDAASWYTGVYKDTGNASRCTFQAKRETKVFCVWMLTQKPHLTCAMALLRARALDMWGCLVSTVWYAIVLDEHAWGATVLNKQEHLTSKSAWQARALDVQWCLKCCGNWSATALDARQGIDTQMGLDAQ